MKSLVGVSFDGNYVARNFDKNVAAQTNAQSSPKRLRNNSRAIVQAGNGDGYLAGMRSMDSGWLLELHKAGDEAFESGFFTGRVSDDRRTDRLCGWLLKLNAKAEAGEGDSALDDLYEKIDHLMKSGGLEDICRLFRFAKDKRFHVDISLGLLTATLPVRSKLPARAKYRLSCEKQIIESGEYEDGLFAGL